jgi:hypothetical protein
MFDEWTSARLRKEHFVLLTLYGAHGKAEREKWLDRVMAMEGLTAKEITRTHGDLLAFGWLEQNIGETRKIEYRLTSSGWKAVAQNPQEPAIAG